MDFGNIKTIDDLKKYIENNKWKIISFDQIDSKWFPFTGTTHTYYVDFNLIL